MSPKKSRRALYSDQDSILVARSRDCIERSRRLLIETEALLDPHRMRRPKEERGIASILRGTWWKSYDDDQAPAAKRRYGS
ncbi:hypothetical protein [Mesorhizobium sp. WSM4887]|uniref:hypothetical protein n=1 Tax=Mesorhizobium sp. WSM4887 TaxID=3038543 RepID=UPI002417CB78|nr:hypothetical protein [Mesorhizobium sp. WSM4887]MDG4889593.1 hypothetical protein [Mesorhizobium sp. WSM4887]